ncbi:MAG: glycoside hydrolase/phage tail family protein [Marinibacterium sp.]|nr:glycoside hydrolase/phage tail family protein [Marinibacterium sp.]
MATIVLGAVGAAIGGSIGGTFAGLSAAVIGRAVGATLGNVIDQRLLGNGSEPVETGRVDRFRLTNVGDGTPITQTHGRARVGGQVIWASDFLETVTTSGGGGGKGTRRPPSPEVREFSYSVSLAVALCEGEIMGVSRAWADGDEVAIADLNMRVYKGTRTQLPDPVIEAVEGQGTVPAYRGTAYVVIEDLPLGRFGNRVPQMSFEVVRAAQPDAPDHALDLTQQVRGVALMPGTGEYALASTPVYYDEGPGQARAANLNSPSGYTDFVKSVRDLSDELPRCDGVSMIVSWFGDDLRCGDCEIRPKVERRVFDGKDMPWVVSSLPRSAAAEIEQIDARPVYGGTPSDASVIEAIRHLNEQGKRVMFYPFILMDQLSGNGRPDPWSGASDQPVLPWRGRITLSQAPGRAGSPDGTDEADAQVARFFGQATAVDFEIADGAVTYTGDPDDWGLRRFILHYAALCAAAGGVESFCIASEMRGLTQIRGAGNRFVAVEQLVALTGDVRALLGDGVKIGYAADWSEYFGYQPQDGSGDRYFHLDPLWADHNIDFVGIDNYMPLADWRDGTEHADAGWGDIHDIGYLMSNIEGGEGYDWYYGSPEEEEAQIRTPILDLAHNEPWIWRYKDIRSWWSNPHHERIGGVRQASPTAWQPQSKPIWFTEIGCASIDKGANQPNKFLDPKSSESRLPKYSNGQRDDLMQRVFLDAVYAYWQTPGRNPVSGVYGGPMLDMDHVYVWAWDARPFPFFPNNRGLWGDGDNYARGHWLNGRAGGRSLASVVSEICRRAGLTSYDVSKLYGFVHGYVSDGVTDARAALQPLMMRFGFDAVERDGVLRFAMRKGAAPIEIDPDWLADDPEVEGRIERRREAEAELSGRVRLRFVEAEGDHAVLAEEAVLPDEATHAVSTSDLSLAMTRGEGRQVAERWLNEARIARDTARFALPPSRLDLGAGDVVRLPDGASGGLYRIDRVEQGLARVVDAVRMEPSVYALPDTPDDPPRLREFVAPVPVYPLFMDLPLMGGGEVPHAPHLAVSARPWPGTVAVYASSGADSFALNDTVGAWATVGVTETALHQARAGIWDEGAPLQVKLIGGQLESREPEAILSGANLAAIGDGTTGNWEMFQFREAELIAPNAYALRGRLRGQLGSDGMMPQDWPVGSVFVLMNGVPQQLDLQPSARGTAQTYRIGPATRGLADPSFVERREAFAGTGLRPYAPAHLRARSVGGDLQISWIRRTRIDGDNWADVDVPLGEVAELYRLRIRQGDTVLREVTLDAPRWTYDAAMRAADQPAAGAEITVAQISDRYGPGLVARLPLP